MVIFAAVLVCLGMAPQPRASVAVSDPDLMRGIDQVKTGDFEAAVSSLELAIRKLSREPQQIKELASAYIYQGVAHLERDEQALALDAFRLGLSRDPGFRMDPFEFSAQQIRVFQSVAPETTSPAAPKARGGSKALPILIGVAAAGGAGIALAGRGSDSPSTARPGPSPTPPTTTPGQSDIVLLGVEPPSGAEIALVRGPRLVTVRVLVSSDSAGTLHVSAFAPTPLQVLEALCVGGSTTSFTLQAGESREQAFGLIHADPAACPTLPFSTSQLRVFLYRDPSPEPLFFRNFPVTYSWVR